MKSPLGPGLNLTLQETAQFCFARGHEYFTLGRYGEADAEYQKGLAADPLAHDGWTGIADVFWVIESWDQAERCYRHSLKLKPGFPPAAIGLAETLTHKGRPADSLAVLDELGDVPEQAADVQIAYGNAYIAQDRYRLAHKSFTRAVKLAPQDAACWRDLAITCEQRGDFEDGLQHYETAVQVSLNNPDGWFSRFTVGCAYLLRGYFEHGWNMYEYRKHNPVWGDHQVYKNERQWEGQALDGTLLLYEEQGLGDLIQFLRYLPITASLCKQVVLDLRPEHRVVAEMVSLPPNVVVKGELAVPFDCVCPLLSQPFLLKKYAPWSPAQPYLKAPSAAGQFPPNVVALTWMGNPKHKNDRRRSIPLELLDPLVRSRPDLVWITLSQEDKAAADIQRTGLPIKRLKTQDLRATSAALQETQLLISVDTAHLHLAGALGKPAWALLPFSPDWRWGLDTPHSPWYPSLRLFRQTGYKDPWPPLIKTVTQELLSWAPNATPTRP